MPKYRFYCKKCKKETTKFANKDQKILCDSCKEIMDRQLPSSVSSEVREVIDPIRNVKWKDNQKELIKNRNDKFYWERIVPDLIREYSLETCLEKGWLYYNDKGELSVGKSAPEGK